MDQSQDPPPSLNPESILSNAPSQLFSAAFEWSKWFMGQRWYVILGIVVFGSFIFMQLESAVEIQRNHRKAKKEGLATAEKENNENEHSKSKTVTFGPTTVHTFSNSDSSSPSISGTFNKIYNLWIVPWIYVFFRSIGLR
jgi:hypothetical protein